MNISSHTIFPKKWKDGQRNYADTSVSHVGTCMTHWYPIDTTNSHIFMMPSNAITLYGTLLSSLPDGTNRFVNSTIMPVNGTIQDRYTPSARSKPFTYILY